MYYNPELVVEETLEKDTPTGELTQIQSWGGRWHRLAVEEIGRLFAPPLATLTTIR